MAFFESIIVFYDYDFQGYLEKVEKLIDTYVLDELIFGPSINNLYYINMVYARIKTMTENQTIR